MAEREERAGLGDRGLVPDGFPVSGQQLGQRNMWCIPCVDAEYVARMEDVLDRDGEVRDIRRLVVRFD